ncbi:MAG: SRPBCC domain-containing protein [Ginsengibacter sp.]
MRQDLVVAESVDIYKSAENVWNALTDPEIIKKYLFGTETTTDWQVGSEIIFQGFYGQNNEHSYRDKGVILENIPNKKLSYSYWSGFSGLEDKPENYSIVSYGLDSIENEKTTFTWKQQGYATEENYLDSQTGMQKFLEQLKEIIESKTGNESTL